MEESNETSGGMRLLETKFFAPTWRAGSVSRPHLIERLNQGLPGKVTLVAAPAGSGKTTLLAEWLPTVADQDRVVCWVSLDSTDNDPALFWTYLITALHRADATVGTGALALLASSRPPAIEQILTDLINQLAASKRRFVLVLDDIHVIEDAGIHNGLDFLIDHLPDGVHIVLASRSDPPLPLARLRARGDLNEIRVADLRFSQDETSRFFHDVMRLDLSGDEATALQQRTEGWIAGLQLAALSLRGRTDTSRFVDDFAGDDRYIVDYLIEEVLKRQPPRIRTFLLQTSIVERICGSLCDAITEGEGSREILEQLDRANLFLVPLDNRREWFRYHHLFADVLRTLLASESPEMLPQLHERASRWFEANNLTADAIRHALDAGDYSRAGGLIELGAKAMRQYRQEATLLNWIGQLPEDEVRRRPVLCALYAAMLLQTGQFARVEDLFAHVERLLLDPPPDMIITDQVEFDRLPTSNAVHRSGIALVSGDIPLAAELAQRALALAGPDDHLHRGAAASLFGLASWYGGDLLTALRSFSAGMESLYLAGNISDTIGGMVVKTDLQIALGQLREAARVCEDALKRAEQHGMPSMRGTADMYTGLAALNLEWNDLDLVRQHLERSRSLGEAAAFPQNPWRMLVLNAELSVLAGDFERAIDLFDEAETVYTGDFHPNVRPIHAMRARVWIRSGNLDRADAWADEHGLSSEAEPTYLREYEQITFARLLLARHRSANSVEAISAAAGLLDRLLVAAQTGGRNGVVIEILIQRALVFAELGDKAAARATLERALTLAEPERYARLFINEGEPIRKTTAGRRFPIRPSPARDVHRRSRDNETRCPGSGRRHGRDAHGP